MYDSNTLFSLYSLFAGVVPRVLWISIGGAIFLGGYEKTMDALNSYENQQ